MAELRKNVTVADLAKEAGVSPATVSRVLNHSHLVNQTTCDKVMEAIDRLGYEMPVQRENIVRRRIDSNIIAVNVPVYENGTFAEYLKGIQTSAFRYEWRPVITQDPITLRTLEDYVKVLHQIHAAGLIVLNSIEKDVLARLNTHLPVVQCGDFNPDCNHSYVGIDDCDASRALVSHLISGGSRKIAFINAPSCYRYARERRRGYEMALAAAGIAIDPAYIMELSEASYAMAHAFLSPMFSSKNRPDAIFAANDTIAYAAIAAAKEHGLSVPEDVAVAGFGNMDISVMSTPKITTVSQPRFQMGFVSCELLHEQWSDQPSPAQSILLNSELIIRGSTR